MRHGRIGLLLALTLITGGTIWLAAQAPKAPMADAEENEDDAKEKAIADRFRKVLESNPRRGTALDRLYGYHVERGTLDKLIEEYAARTKQNDKDGVAWMVIGLVEAQRGKDGAAVAAFTKAEAALPGALPSYYLGQTQVLIGKPDEAAAAFERAIARKPQRNDLLDVYGALGRIYQRSQKPEKALEVWTRLEQQFPDDARVQEQIATSLQEEGQYEQALPRVEKLAKATDDKYRQATLRMEAADLKVKLKRTPDALTDFEKILGELNPDSWLYRDVRRRIEDVFLRNDDLAGLAKYYEKWLEKNPTDIDAIARLAKNLTSQGRGPDAQKWLQKGLESAPSNRSLRQALIDQLAYEGKFTEAAAQYEAMAKTDPGNPDILRDWGKLLARDSSKPEVERKANAATVWKKILEKKPTDPVATAQVAELMRVGGAEEEAIALYKKAIELAPNQPQYREYLGEYYHALKRSADAISTWRPIAEGENRNAKNLTRLAEVFAGFGYRKEAINAMGQAISLEKDDFNLLTSYADLLHQEGQHDEARKQIDLAAKFTSNAEEVEQILVARIKIDTSLEKLGERIDELVRDLGDTPTAEKLLVLARYYEANKQSDKAVEAINQAAAKDAKSIPVLTAAARIHEAGGNLLAAADANRKLATVDRRFRTEYLTAVMKLEQRLGRRKEALQAGKDLIASAPGNPEVYKTYSDLCFQIGELDEGLEALRRSVRANPGEPASLISLANALIDRGRSGEAIELFWRAYDKSTDLEGKLTIIDRLAAQYLEANQFDKLIERLERERGESEKVREGTLALAQAYQSAGDLGTARQQLERLLTENTRDTNLLSQLSQLCEQEGDMTSALKYQRQLSAAAPQNFDAKVRLATLLIRSGEGEEGAAVWVKFIAEANEPHRNLQAIDTLISNSRIDTAKSILSRMLATQPANWELLYREGAVLASEGKRDEAARRFQAIVALKKNDDELGEMLQYQAKMAAKKKENDDKKKNSNMPTAVPSQLVRNTQPKSSDSEPPVVRRLGQVNQIRQVTGIEERYYRYQQQSNFYAPQDYGEARMAALGFLYEFGRANNTQDTFVKAMRDAKDRPNADPRSLWDWYYLQQLRQDTAAILPTALALAKASNDPIAAHTYLSTLPTRTVVQGRRISAAKLPVDKTPPLPAEQLDFMLATFKRLKQSQPNWVSPSILAAVTTELKRGKREQDEKTIYAELLNSADTPQKILNVMTASAEKDDYETTLAMFQRLEQLQPARDRNSRTLQRSTVQDSYWSLTPLMCKRLAAKKYDDGLSILDRYLGASRKSNINTPKTASSQPRRPTAISNQYINIYDTTNNYWTSKQITYPVPNNYYSASELTVLLNAFEQFKKADLVSDLFTHFQKQVGTVPPAEQSFVQLALAYMHWWNDEKDEALIMLEQVAAANTSDFQMTFEVASLREQNNEHGEALNLLDTINPNDHQTMQRREEIVLRLAERTGNVDRARLAAERLFGLRLDSDKQLELAGKMHRLGMHQLAETVLARAQRQAGNKTNTLVSLMNQHQTNGQVEQAVAIARQLLRKTQFASTNTRGNTDDGSNIRSQAVGVLARSGQLKELIERTEAQLKVSPKSLPIHQQLLTYYQAANDIPKQKAAIKTIIELKPEDGRLRFSMAQLQQNLGDKQAAIENYKEAIKREPMMFQNSYYEIERLFSEAGKFEELVNLIDSVDYRKLGNYWQIANLLEPLFQKDKTRDLAMKMFKKAWDAFPTERAYLMGNVRNEHIWQIPEIYDYLRQALIPKDELSSDPWQPFTNVISYEGDGRTRTIVSKMLQLARQQHRLPELRTEVTEAIKKHPTWVVGRAMLAIIDIQMGNKAEGIATWEKLFADPNLDIPAMARGTLAQELEYYSGVEKSVIRAMEASIDELLNDTQNSQEWQYTPARRLVWWYEQTGRIDDARKLLVKASRTERPNPGYSGGYWEYRQLNDGMNFGNELLRLGDSIEAMRIFQNLLADPDKIAAASNYWGGSFESQVADGVKKSMKAIKPEAMPQVIETLLTPRVTNSTNKTAFDLMIGSDAREFAKLRMTSVFDTVFQTLAKTETNGMPLGSGFEPHLRSIQTISRFTQSR